MMSSGLLKYINACFESDYYFEIKAKIIFMALNNKPAIKEHFKLRFTNTVKWAALLCPASFSKT